MATAENTGKKLLGTWNQRTENYRARWDSVAGPGTSMGNFGAGEYKPPIFPQYNSGARTFIQVGGMPFALALEFSYQIQAETEEIRTIDSSFPWDIAVGQVKITGTMRGFVDPDSSFEEVGLFHTMQSILHQPYVEVLVQDVNGNADFFARGMFTSCQAAYNRGQLTIRSAGFIGVAYQHWAYQTFRPYRDTKKNIFDNAKDMVNKVSSGAQGFGF